MNALSITVGPTGRCLAHGKCSDRVVQTPPKELTHLTDYEAQNDVKASFDDVYTAPTPHGYLQNMTAVDYRMTDLMNPFVSAVVDASATTDGPVKVLDVGCSYGISGALLKTNCAYGDLAEFYRDEASPEFSACVTETRRWLGSRSQREDVEVVGFDSSEPAIKFAAASNMIDAGIACNLEAHESQLTLAERSLVQQCDVLLSTGAIGYVTDRTVGPLLEEFGHGGHGALGPVAIISVLELFDPEPIARSFTDHGFRFGPLSVRLPQRRFADEAERRGVIGTLQQRGLPTAAQESENTMFANLWIAAQPDKFQELTHCLIETHDEVSAPPLAGC